MRFGELPSWAIELSDLVHAVVLSSYPDVLDSVELGNRGGPNEAFPFPAGLLLRNPLFDQLIANLYHPGEVRVLLRAIFAFLMKLRQSDLRLPFFDHSRKCTGN